MEGYWECNKCRRRIDTQGEFGDWVRCWFREPGTLRECRGAMCFVSTAKDTLQEELAGELSARTIKCLHEECRNKKEVLALLNRERDFLLRIPNLGRVSINELYVWAGREPPYKGFNVYPTRRRVNIERDDEIVKKREQGMSYAAIGREYGISKDRVRQIVFKAEWLP